MLPDRPLLGEPMHTAGLTHEPVNEMGVSMLFAMMARDLVLIPEQYNPDFRIAGQRWKCCQEDGRT